MNAKFYHLATNPVRGPKLHIRIPEELVIIEKDPLLPALDHHLIYNKEEIDLDLEGFDATFSTIYIPKDMSEDDEDTYSNDHYEWSNNVTSDSSEARFNTTVNDCDLPEEMQREIRTRDMLEQF